MAEITEHHKKVKEIVEEQMIKNPECRNNDTFLVLKIWQDQGFDVDHLLTNIKGITDFESIRRNRQLIQSEGRLLPTDPEVAVKRIKDEEKLRKYYGKLNAY